MQRYLDRYREGMLTEPVKRTGLRTPAVGRQRHCRRRSENLPLVVSGKERKVDRRMWGEVHRRTEMAEVRRRIEMAVVRRTIEMEEGHRRIEMVVDVSRGIEMAEGHRMMVVDVSREIGMEVAPRRIGTVVVCRSRNRNWEVDLGGRTC